MRTRSNATTPMLAKRLITNFLFGITSRRSLVRGYSAGSDKISNFKIVKLDQSPYLKPLRVEFEINGIQKKWDLLHVHNSASTLIYNKTRKVVVLVKQFRPSLYVGQIPNLREGIAINSEEHPVAEGYSIELCGGICDKEASLESIVRDEVLEECGYEVKAQNLRHLFNLRGVGVTGNVTSVFYVEVEDSNKVALGGGLRSEGEFIDVLEMSVPEFKKYIYSVDLKSPANVVAAAMWFFAKVPAGE